MVRVSDFERFVFVVGAPRCGTTSLSKYLKSHPSVRFPAAKEPHFFALNDLRGLSDDELRDTVEREYLGRFFDPGSNRSVGADCSVTYLYRPELLEPVLRLWPDSRFVIAVRDPLTMLPSLHKRLLFIGDETLTSFADAWEAVPDRAAGRRIPRRCADPRWLRYDEAGRFGTYVERLFEVVGRDRCKVMVFDDLCADPAKEYQEFIAFCGLEPAARPDLKPERSGRGVRLYWLQRLLKRPPKAVVNYVATDLYLRRTGTSDRAAKAGIRGMILGLRRRLLDWNKVSAPAEPLPLALQQTLRTHFKAEIAKLGRLIGRDLSHWLRPVAAKESASRQEGCSASLDQTAPVARRTG